MSCTAINQNTAEEIVDTVDNVLLDCDGMMQPLFVSSPAKQEPHRDLLAVCLSVCHALLLLAPHVFVEY